MPRFDDVITFTDDQQSTLRIFFDVDCLSFHYGALSLLFVLLFTRLRKLSTQFIFKTAAIFITFFIKPSL